MIILPKRASPAPVISTTDQIPANDYVDFPSGDCPRREKMGEAKLRDQRAQEAMP